MLFNPLGAFFNAIGISILMSGATMLAPTFAAANPLYSSTADTVFDIITVDDPSDYVCLKYQGRVTRQMWDKRVDGESDFEVFLFQAHFSNSAPIDIIVNPEFVTRQAAETEARRYTRALGQLPLVFRHGIRQLGIFDGTPTYSAGAGKIFVYAERTTRRISQNHLEESLLHEAAHVSLDPQHAKSDAWIAAQNSDNQFMTKYGKDNPKREDLAETALFAYGMIHYPERIPPVDSRDILQAVPARIEFFYDILNQEMAEFPAPTPSADCR